MRKSWADCKICVYVPSRVVIVQSFVLPVDCKPIPFHGRNIALPFRLVSYIPVPGVVEKLNVLIPIFRFNGFTLWVNFANLDSTIWVIDIRWILISINFEEKLVISSQTVNYRISEVIFFSIFSISCCLIIIYILVSPCFINKNLRLKNYSEWKNWISWDLITSGVPSCKMWCPHCESVHRALCELWGSYFSKSTLWFGNMVCEIAWHELNCVCGVRSNSLNISGRMTISIKLKCDSWQVNTFSRYRISQKSVIIVTCKQTCIAMTTYVNVPNFLKSSFCMNCFSAWRYPSC